jgi:hypothetical protein
VRVTVHLDVVPIADTARRLLDALDDELEAAVRRSTSAVAFAARADHPYTDRTHNLTRSTRDYAPRGRASEGTLRGEVGAYMEYASFVEGKPRFAFLDPAFERSRDHFDQYRNDALEAAVRRVS